MKDKIICTNCGKEFEHESYKGKKRKYCCLECQREATANNRNNRRKDLISEYNHKGYLAKEIIYLYKAKCAICGWRASDDIIISFKGYEFARGNEIHHIIPVRDGGKSNFNNLILLCPNHHKQADMGIITQKELTKYLKQPKTEEEKQELMNKSIDRVAAALFETEG